MLEELTQGKQKLTLIYAHNYDTLLLTGLNV